MATYQDDDVVRVMLAEMPGAEASQAEVGAALRELLSTNLPGITNEQVGRCLMKALCEAARREKEAETLAPSFAEALAKIPGSPGVPNVETLRELIEAFLYTHQGTGEARTTVSCSFSVGNSAGMVIVVKEAPPPSPVACCSGA